MSTFTINSIDREKGHVEVTYSIDGKKQKMCDVPLMDDLAIKAFLDEYGARYEESLAHTDAQELEAAAEAKVDALVGQTFSITKG